MSKKLDSGLVVSSADYYALLEWKDRNIGKFLAFCVSHNEPNNSLNQMSEENYNTLLTRHIVKESPIYKDKFLS